MAQRGFSAGELLFLLPCLILVGVLTAILTSQAHLMREHEATYRKELLSSRLSEAYQTAVSNLDSHRFDIPLKVHAPGVISLINGVPHPITHHPGDLKPSEQAEALTTVALATQNDLQVFNCSLSGDGVRVEACFRHQAPEEELNISQLLGVGATALSEWHGQAEGLGACRTLHLKSVTGMIAEELAPSSQCSLHLLVPIKALYSLYVDQANNVRYLAHRGSEITENQPLVKGVKSVRLNLSQIAPYRISFLNVAAVTTDNLSLRLAVFNSLNRGGFFDYLLNP